MSPVGLAGDPEGSAVATASVAPHGQRLLVVRVVCEAHLHFDGLAFISVGQGVGAGRRTSDCSVVAQPLVGEGGVCPARPCRRCP